MKITYLSHSCVHIDTGEHKILIDPYLTGNPLAITSPDDVECDFIFLTHGHDDHVGDTAAIARRTGATLVANYELATHFSQEGLTCHGMYHGGKWQFPFGTAKMVIAHHGSGMSGLDGKLVYMGNPGGWVFTIDDKSIYHAGDTSLFLEMELIGRMHSLDIAFLPIGDNFTMGPEEAIEALKLLQPKSVVPIHYNTWDVIKVDPQEFAKQASDLGVQPCVLGAGQSIEL